MTSSVFACLPCSLSTTDKTLNPSVQKHFLGTSFPSVRGAMFVLMSGSQENRISMKSVCDW